MANKIGNKTLNNGVDFLFLDANPSSDGIGYPAKLGSVAVFTNQVNTFGMAQKFGANDVDWYSIPVGLASSIFFDNEEAEEVYTSSTPSEKFSSTHTVDKAGAYLAVMFYENHSSNDKKGKQSIVQCQYSINGATPVEFSNSYEHGKQYKASTVVTIINLSDGDSIKLAFNHFATKGSSYLRRTRIFLMRTNI